MKRRVITIDLGDTLFDRRQKIPFGHNYVYGLFPAAEGVIRGWRHGEKESGRHSVSFISKIEPGTEVRVSLSLFRSGIVPHVVPAQNVHFCYARAEKGAIAKRLKSQIHIDDRMEALASTYAVGVRHNILFVEGHDDRKREGKGIEVPNLLVARNWDEVFSLVDGLP